MLQDTPYAVEELFKEARLKDDKITTVMFRKGAPLEYAVCFYQEDMTSRWVSGLNPALVQKAYETAERHMGLPATYRYSIQEEKDAEERYAALKVKLDGLAQRAKDNNTEKLSGEKLLSEAVEKVLTMARSYIEEHDQDDVWENTVERTKLRKEAVDLVEDFFINHVF